MSDRTIYMPDLDFEYKVWKNRTEFIKEENLIHTNRIEEIKSTDRLPNETGKLNNLKDRFLKQADRVQKIHNRILVSEREMVYYKFDYPINKKHQHYLDHENLRSEIEEVEQNHLRLLNDFNKYLV